MTHIPRVRRIYPGEWIAALVVLAVIAIIIIGCHRVRACDPATIQPGSFLFSRWNDESKNTSPGWLWNHCGVTSADGNVIEALIGPGVVKSPLTNYSGNSELYYVIIPPPTPEIGARIAWYAETQLGKPYRRTASIGTGIVRDWLGFPFENCTSLAADSLRFATGRPLFGTWTPDALYRVVYYAYYRPAWWQGGAK